MVQGTVSSREARKPVTRVHCAGDKRTLISNFLPERDHIRESASIFLISDQVDRYAVDVQIYKP